MGEPTEALVDMAKCWLEERVRSAKLFPATMPAAFVEVPVEFAGSMYEFEGPRGLVLLPRAYLLWSMMPYRLFVGSDERCGYVGVQAFRPSFNY